MGVVRPIVEPLWKPKQAAAYLGVSVDWVYDHVNRREPLLPAIIFGVQGKGQRPVIRFNREDLEAWVAQFSAANVSARVV
jgi:excisionase family DNA binding protein